jgi:DNA recombination protein RmuC
MDTTLIVVGIVTILIGFAIGYFFSKGFNNKKAIQIETALSNEQKFHSETKQELIKAKETLNTLNGQFQAEQKERVKFQTQYSEGEKQIKSFQSDLEKYKAEDSNKNQELIKIQSQKTRAETELREANHRIDKLNADVQDQVREISNFREKIIQLTSTNADLSAKYQEALKAIEEQKKFVIEANNTLKEAFASLSSEALKSNNQSFLDLAKTSLEKHLTESKTDLEKRQQAIDSMIKPLNESLTKFDAKIQDIEKSRQGAYSEIKVFLDNMKGTTEKLQKETNTLVTALKSSQVRGKYGEIGLRRVVEFAGMSEFCDYDEQASVTTEDGRLRPDLIVKLPGQRKVIVDAKVPLSSYMQAFETTDETERKDLLLKHSLSVRDHLKKLSAKSYWTQFDDTPDYVVMYLQIESSFGSALENDRNLIEDGINNGIIFATPTTLITMLRTVAFSWQQVRIAENIYQIRDAGIELFNRVTTLIQHIAAVGSNLNSATLNYNKVVGSLESRFIPQVKKLKEIGGTLMDKEIPELTPIDNSLRPLNELPDPNFTAPTIT